MAGWWDLEVSASPSDCSPAPHRRERTYTVVSTACTFLLCAHVFGQKLPSPPRLQLRQPGEYFVHILFTPEREPKTRSRFVPEAARWKRAKRPEVSFVVALGGAARFWSAAPRWRPGGGRGPGRGVHGEALTGKEPPKVSLAGLPFRAVTALLQSYSTKKRRFG